LETGAKTKNYTKLSKSITLSDIPI